MNGKIYEITNLLNGKRYFGQTTKPYGSMRWAEHNYEARTGKNRCHLYAAIRKYGVENFQFKVIIENIQSQNELNRLERVWIEQCNTINREHGYNMADGGSNGKMSEEVKRKISIAHKGKPGNVGNKLSVETRALMSKIAKEKHRVPPMSEEIKKKISQALTGIKRPHRAISEEQKTKLSLAAKKFWKGERGQIQKERLSQIRPKIRRQTIEATAT